MFLGFLKKLIFNFIYFTEKTSNNEQNLLQPRRLKKIC